MKAILLLVATIIVMLVGTATGGVPGLINYQGRLTSASGQPVSDGAYLIRFVIYDAPTGGSPLWDNNYRTIQVTAGLFTYALGDSTPFPPTLFSGDTTRWLGIKVDAGLEMTPRVRLASVPFAYKAVCADSATSSTRAQFADSSNASAHSVHSDTTRHAVYADSARIADTARYISGSMYLARLAVDSLTDTTTSLTPVQVGPTLSVAPGVVKHYIIVVLRTGCVLGVTAGNATASYDLSIGVSGSEIHKDGGLIGGLAASAGVSGSQWQTFQYYYEPTVTEKSNGFNLKIFMNCQREGTSGSAYAYLLRAEVFGL